MNIVIRINEGSEGGKKCSSHLKTNTVSHSEINNSNNTNVIGKIYSDVLDPYFQTISEKPAISSKGFSNTFRLLQNRLQSNELRATILTVSNLLSVDLEPRIGLQIGEVIERLHVLIEDENTNSSQLTVGNSEDFFQIFVTKISPLISLLYNFLIQKIHKENSKYLMNYDISMLLPEILRNQYRYGANKHINKIPMMIPEQVLKYYVGRDIRGKNCLRVIRNIEYIHTKGKLYIFINFFSSL